MRILKYCLLAMLWPAMNGYAQSPPAIVRTLTIGDTIPDIESGNVINYPVSKIHLSDLKDKLIILDFWSSSCGSCLALFPHLQDLQNRFSGRLQILLVNGKSRLYKDTEFKIRNILERYKARTGHALDLPVIFNCTELDERFPWRVIPQEVWILNKKVIAITGSDPVNETNIRQVLNGRQVNFPLKSDEMIDLHKETLFALDRKPFYASILFKGLINGLNGLGLIHDSLEPAHYTGWYMLNQSLLFIYKTVFRGRMNYDANRIIYAFRDSALISCFEKNTLFSYQVSVPSQSLSAMMAFLQRDLSARFPISFKVEKRRIDCYVLKTDRDTTHLVTRGGTPEWITDPIDRDKHIRNYSLTTILSDFNSYSGRPLLNESGMSANIDLKIPYDTLNEQTMLASLRSAGFIITEEPRIIDVLVLSDQYLLNTKN